MYFKMQLLSMLSMISSVDQTIIGTIVESFSLHLYVCVFNRKHVKSNNWISIIYYIF